MRLELAQGLTLYFSRHGQTEANLAKLFSGKKDTQLTALGRAQAQEIGSVLKRELGPKPGIACVSSPLARARMTMEIARQAAGLPAQGYAIDPRIQEIDLGRWDQLTDDEARALDPDYFDRRGKDKWDVRVPWAAKIMRRSPRVSPHGWLISRPTPSQSATAPPPASCADCSWAWAPPKCRP